MIVASCKNGENGTTACAKRHRDFPYIYDDSPYQTSYCNSKPDEDHVGFTRSSIGIADLGNGHGNSLRKSNKIDNIPFLKAYTRFLTGNAISLRSILLIITPRMNGSCLSSPIVTPAAPDFETITGKFSVAKFRKS